jgi:hypothetical protein
MPQPAERIRNFNKEFGMVRADWRRSSKGVRSGSIASNACEQLEARSLMTAPVIGAFVATPNAAPPGSQIVLGAEASDIDGVRGVTFFRDVNKDGGWTQGVDEDLGFARIRSTNGRFELNATTGADWGADAWIAAAAVDELGNWGQPSLLSVYQNRAPVVMLATLQQTNVAPGRAFFVDALVTDAGRVSSITAFLDTDGDNRYTAHVDLLLGRATGSRITEQFVLGTGEIVYRATIAATAGAAFPNGRVLVEAMDAEAARSERALRTTQTLVVDPAPEVTAFEVSGTSIGIGVTRRFRGVVVDDGGSSVRAVTLFQDMNNNGRWDGPSVDIDLGVAVPNNAGAFDVTLPVFAADGVSGRFVATAVDARFSGDGWGVPRSAMVTAIPRVDLPTITPIQTAFTLGDGFEVGVDFGSSPFTGTVQVVWDRNADGLWTAGVDTTLSSPIGTNGRTGVLMIGVTPTVMRTLGPGGDERMIGIVMQRDDGPERTITSRSVRVRGTTINVTSVTPAPIRVGAVVNVDLLSLSANQTTGLSGFIDLNGNGFDTGDRMAATLVRLITEVDRTARWLLSFDTTGIAPGTYDIVFAARDFEGAWGARSSVRITIDA